MISAARLQRAGEIVMVLGIVALCQPWNLFLHRYGLTIIIAGLLTFMFTGWFGKPGVETGPAAAAEAEGVEATDGVFDVSDHHDGVRTSVSQGGRP